MTFSLPLLLPFLLLLLTPSVVAAEFKVILLHTNDIHDRFEQFEPRGGGTCSAKRLASDGCYGGMSRLVSKVKEIRANNPNVLFLDAGDWFVGTSWFHAYAGKAAAYFMNKLKYDAMALGNHEFDYGPDALLPFLQNVTHPVVDTNIVVKNEGQGREIKKYLKKSITVELGGQKIGILGYTTPHTTSVAIPGPLFVFEDEVTALNREVQKLLDQGITKIFAVGHSGFKMDMKIARQVKGIDVVVGGHTNTFLYTGKPPSYEKPVGKYPKNVTNEFTGKPALCVQDYTFGKYLGYLEVTFDDNGDVISWEGNPIIMDNKVKQDPETESEVQAWAAKVKALDAKVVGSSRVLLNGDRTVCRGYECNMGNLIADALAYRYMKSYDENRWAEVGLAIVNAGGVRSSIEPGNITWGDINTVQPFKNTIAVLEMYGKYIWEAFEWSVSDYNPQDFGGKYLQPSGFKVVFDVSQPVNSRVVSLHVLCVNCSMPTYEPIQDDKLYKFATYIYLAEGGDGFTVFRDKRVSIVDYGDTDTDTTVAYIKKHDPVMTPVSMRSIHVHKDKDANKSTDAAGNKDDNRDKDNDKDKDNGGNSTALCSNPSAAHRVTPPVNAILNSVLLFLFLKNFI